MALQDKSIMPPPWLAHREIERYSIGWRMGYGEDYIDRFGDWLDTLSPEERTEYRALFPEPVTWKGWWDDEDSSEVLEHGDFLVDAWQPEGQPKYTRQWLQQEFAAGRKRELCLFWGHQLSEDGQLTKSCLSQWWMEDFYTTADSYLCMEQYMMAAKAELFGDKEIRDQILKCGDQKQIKAPHLAAQGLDLLWIAAFQNLVPDLLVAKQLGFARHHILFRVEVGVSHRIEVLHPPLAEAALCYIAIFRRLMSPEQT